MTRDRTTMSRTIPWVAILMTGYAIAARGGPQNDQAARETWEAPAEARTEPNPIELSSEVLAEGQALYQRNCQLCHGPEGRGDGPATKYVKPAPADITTPEAQAAMTDGGMFWKLTTGRTVWLTMR